GQCVHFQAAALDPVPLDGLSQSDALSNFVSSESITNQDLNADGDDTDDVAQVADRRTGEMQVIGAGVATGRAVVRVRETGFTSPGVATEGNVVAVLESEPGEGIQDENGNDVVFDSILRIFVRWEGGISELTSGRNIAVEALPIVGGRSLAVSDGLVFYRRS